MSSSPIKAEAMVTAMSAPNMATLFTCEKPSTAKPRASVKDVAAIAEEMTKTTGTEVPTPAS